MPRPLVACCQILALIFTFTGIDEPEQAEPEPELAVPEQQLMVDTSRVRLPPLALFGDNETGTRRRQFVPDEQHRANEPVTPSTYAAYAADDDWQYEEEGAEGATNLAFARWLRGSGIEGHEFVIDIILEYDAVREWAANVYLGSRDLHNIAVWEMPVPPELGLDDYEGAARGLRHLMYDYMANNPERFREIRADHLAGIYVFRQAYLSFRAWSCYTERVSRQEASVARYTKEIL
jgi:hypothetical protein